MEEASGDYDFIAAAALMMLEVLHGLLVLLRRLSRGERPKISSLSCLGVPFARVQAILACFEFSNHGASSGAGNSREATRLSVGCGLL